MNQFRSDFFEFGRRDSQLENWRIVQVGNGDFKSKFGNDYNIETTTNINGSENLISCNPKTQDISFTICKMTKDGLPLSVDDDEMDDLVMWLKDSTPKMLKGGNRFYYGIFTDVGEQDRKYGEYCLIDLKFHSLFPWSLGYLKSSCLIDVESNYVETLYNSSTVSNDISLVVEVELLGETSEITITNLSTGVVFSMKGIDDKNDKDFKINTIDSYEFVENNCDEDRDLGRYIQKPRDFIYLQYGRNDIEIKTNGEALVRLSYRENFQFV